MRDYILKRLATVIPILIGISFLSFALISLSPSNPAEVALRVNEIVPTEEEMCIRDRSCVIASTFARIFYRNAINIGLPILECDEAAKGIEEGDKVEIDFNTGVIKNITKNETYQAEPFPEFMQNIIQNGGLIKSIEKNK